jgi:NADH pyrophosphatase NudC (nudix superfamily)
MSHYNVSVSCILEFQNKILMIQKIQHDKIFFGLSDGFQSEEETIQDAVIREIKANIGVVVENPLLVKIYQFIRSETINFEFVFHYQLTDWDVAKIKLQENESSKVRFFTKREIKMLLEHKSYENTLSAMKMTDYLGLDKENLSFCVVRG